MSQTKPILTEDERRQAWDTAHALWMKGDTQCRTLSSCICDHLEAAFTQKMALAALQAQPAEVSDEPTEAQIAAGMRELFAGPKPWPSWEVTLKRVYQAMFALRPQSESEARRAAQEQLYTERERHTAEVKRLQAEIGRLKSERPQAVPMTEEEFVACLTKANCIGVVKMSYDSGPYDITRPSINASKLKEAVEAHHGITAPAGGEGDRG